MNPACAAAAYPWLCHLMSHAMGIGSTLLIAGLVWFYLPRPVKWLVGIIFAVIAAIGFGLYRLLRRRHRPAREA